MMFRYGNHNIREEFDLRRRVMHLVVKEWLAGSTITEISRSVSVNQYYVRRFIHQARRWSVYQAINGHWLTDEMRKQIRDK